MINHTINHAMDIPRSEKAQIRAQYRMLGNAVCPPLIAAIAAAVVGEVKARGDPRCVLEEEQKEFLRTLKCPKHL